MECWQVTQSNSSRVVLQSINFDTSATYCCEVSTDLPYFQTYRGHGNLTVISEFFFPFSLSLSLSLFSLMLFRVGSRWVIGGSLENHERIIRKSLEEVRFSSFRMILIL